MNKKKLLLITLLGLLTITPIVAFAQNLLPPCTASGNCGLCDFITLGLNVFRWILGLVGGLSLLLFVWHGWGWLMSGGDSEKVKKTKDALVHTVIGIVIILASWLIVNMVVVLLTYNAADPSAPGLTPTKEGIGVIFKNQAWNNLEAYCGKK